MTLEVVLKVPVVVAVEEPSESGGFSKQNRYNKRPRSRHQTLGRISYTIMAYLGRVLIHHDDNLSHVVEFRDPTDVVHRSRPLLVSLLLSNVNCYFQNHIYETTEYNDHKQQKKASENSASSKK